MFGAAKLSRYCQLGFEYPSSTDNAQAFVDAVLEFSGRQSIDLIVPITDWTLQPLSEHRARFEGTCRVVLPPHDAVVAASDKYRTVDLARTMGIVVPRTWLIKTHADLGGLLELTFPLVVKDRFSVRWSGSQAVFGSVTYVFGKEELERKVTERLRLAEDVLVQEFVSGSGIGLSFFVTREDVYLPFAWKRIREVDPRGSASSCRKSIALDEKLVTQSSRLIRAIGFEGIAMVEYKIAGSGPPVLMEINGRPWGSIALPIASGIDYPRYLIDWGLKGSLPPQNIAYGTEITCRRVVGELTHLSNVRKGKPHDWPLEYPKFWSTLAKVAIPWYPGMHYDDLWLSDLRPVAAQVRNWFRVRRKK
jgi:predicted ATP-grasp superfamily ATP-dependent carboligase